MNGDLYVMITTRGSRKYTHPALKSFFKNTVLTDRDEFLLIDNDNENSYQAPKIILNKTPKSFSQNCNDMINLAGERKLFLLNNDIIFTPKWNLPLKQFSNAIILPSCNQTHLYKSGNLELKSSMALEEYDNQDHELINITQIHNLQQKRSLFEKLLMGFYAFMLSPEVNEKIGYFDETFGIGGGEDIDYRIRAIVKGIPVKYITKSYLLHFAGKSTWDGPENQQEINERNKKYFACFSNKWGEDLANLCLVGGNASKTIEKYQLGNLINNQEFSAAIKLVLNKSNRDNGK